jgi:hypothetical protein
VVDQQPDVELDAGQFGRREPVDAFPECRAGDGERVDAVGLAAITSGAALAGHQPGRHANDAFAVDEQETLEGTRDVAAVLKRPDPVVAQARRPIQRGGEPALTDRDGRVAEQLAGARDDSSEGVRALVRVRTEHDHRLRPFLETQKWTPGGQGLLGGGATLLICAGT